MAWMTLIQRRQVRRESSCPLKSSTGYGGRQESRLIGQWVHPNVCLGKDPTNRGGKGLTLASNPPAYHATKSIWTLDHWQDFGRRCRAMRADIKRFIEYFPLTPGLDAKTYNAIYPLWAKADTACCQAIETFERQYPDRAEESKEIIFADTQRRLFMQFKGSGDSRILSRDEWIGLGIEVKGIHDAAWALAFEFQTAKYARIPMIEKFFRSPINLTTSSSHLWTRFAANSIPAGKNSCSCSTDADTAILVSQ